VTFRPNLRNWRTTLSSLSLDLSRVLFPRNSRARVASFDGGNFLINGSSKWLKVPTREAFLLSLSLPSLPKVVLRRPESVRLDHRVRLRIAGELSRTSRSFFSRICKSQSAIRDSREDSRIDWIYTPQRWRDLLGTFCTSLVPTLSLVVATDFESQMGPLSISREKSTMKYPGPRIVKRQTLIEQSFRHMSTAAIKLTSSGLMSPISSRSMTQRVEVRPRVTCCHRLV